MFDDIYALIIVNFIALMWSAVLFMPPKWIRWGWLWALQILITEWIFLSIVVSLLVIYIAPSTVWFMGVLLFYLSKGKYSLQSSGRFSIVNRDGPLKVLKAIAKNAFPFRVRPQSIEWSPSGEHLRHLRFPRSNHKSVCIHIHGGAWIHGDARQLTSVVRFFYENETEVVSINYPKYPSLFLPEIIRSVEQTFLAICSEYGPNRKFILYGRSAGGYLALRLATRFPEKIERVVALYPVTDFQSLEVRSSDKDILKTRSWIRSIVGGSSGQKQGLYAQLSLIGSIKAAIPPILIVHGVNDPVVTIQQSDLCYKTMAEQGVPITYLRFKVGTHGFDALWEGFSMQTFKRALSEFLKS